MFRSSFQPRIDAVQRALRPITWRPTWQLTAIPLALGGAIGIYSLVHVAPNDALLAPRTGTFGVTNAAVVSQSQPRERVEAFSELPNQSRQPPTRPLAPRSTAPDDAQYGPAAAVSIPTPIAVATPVQVVIAPPATVVPTVAPAIPTIAIAPNGVEPAIAFEPARPSFAPALPARPPGSTILSAPFHSQFDGSVWAPTNCGPTSLSMALGALQVNVDQLTLRHLANAQMHTNTTRGGTTWEALAYAAEANGASVEGLYGGEHYRTWTFDDLQSELAQGHPVTLLVRYQYLPDHAQSTFRGDHYIVALGVDAKGNLVYNDPAFRSSAGAGRTISQTALKRAWTGTAEGLVRTAMALMAKA